MAGSGSFEAGTIELGAGSPRAEGTVNLSGGTLQADSITKGVGTAVFNFTGGTLDVGTFGFELEQEGGILSRGLVMRSALPRSRVTTRWTTT